MRKFTTNFILCSQAASSCYLNYHGRGRGVSALGPKTHSRPLFPSEPMLCERIKAVNSLMGPSGTLPAQTSTSGSDLDRLRVRCSCVWRPFEASTSLCSYGSGGATLPSSSNLSAHLSLSPPWPPESVNNLNEQPAANLHYRRVVERFVFSLAPETSSVLWHAWLILSESAAPLGESDAVYGRAASWRCCSGWKRGGST